MKTITINIELANEILNYLAKQPYIETFALIGKLQDAAKELQANPASNSPAENPKE